MLSIYGNTTAEFCTSLLPCRLRRRSVRASVPADRRQSARHDFGGSGGVRLVVALPGLERCLPVATQPVMGSTVSLPRHLYGTRVAASKISLNQLNFDWPAQPSLVNVLQVVESAQTVVLTWLDVQELDQRTYTASLDDERSSVARSGHLGLTCTSRILPSLMRSEESIYF